MEPLRVHCITWNVEGSWPEQSLNVLLELDKVSPDIFCISLQEVRSQPQNYVLDTIFEEPWTLAFRECLADFDYVRITGERLQGLVTSIFVRRHHLPHLRDIKTIVTRTGLAGFWGNKGAACVRFSIHGCSICFVNSHLAAHDHGYDERCLHYNTIVDNTSFTIQETSNILYHDYVFWSGDLNFRLSGDESSAEIVKKILANEIEGLHLKDELRMAQTSNAAFGPLIEAPVTFAPTYKYQKNSESFDLNRRPAWTDRILHQVHKDAYENARLSVDQHLYTSVPQYGQSDHKPVKAHFSIKVFSHHEERCVHFDPIKQWFIGTNNKIKYTVDSDVVVSPWDYVAIFKANFSSIHQYVTYLYVPQESNDKFSNLANEDNAKKVEVPRERVVEFLFGDELIQTPGMYILLYYSGKYTSYLGMSEPFRVDLRED